jgi:O-antigen ligase
MIAANPITGVGLGKFQSNYVRYDPNAVAGEPFHGTRVAHNSYLQIWAECGTPSFLLYLGLIGLTFFDLWRIRRTARQRYHSSWILSYATMFEASMVAFVIGSVFLNRAHFDLFYHYVAIVIVFGTLARAEMEDLVRYPLRAGGRRAPLVAHPSPGFGGLPAPAYAERTFRNTPLVGGSS